MSSPRVKCPQCARVVEWSAANPFRPFCSERCRLVDLGGWLTERYAVPGEPDALSEDESRPGRRTPGEPGRGAPE